MDTINLPIVKPLLGGMGLGFHDGMAVFVKGALPGEEVKVRIEETHKDYRIARIVDIISVSPERIDPQCPIYEQCGGCDYLHASATFEIEIKKRVLTDSLERIAGLKPGETPAIRIEHSERFAYRSHASFHCRGGKRGFYGKRSREIIPLPPEGCALCAPEINGALSALHTDDDLRALRIAVDCGGSTVTSIEKNRTVREEVGGWLFNRDVEQFFQTNRFLRPGMQSLACEMALNDDRSLAVDIGCGVGFFSLPLGAEFERVAGYDIDSGAIAMARVNAGLNGIETAEFFALSASRIHPSRIGASTVLVDPPRAGLSRSARGTILAAAPSVIVYVSCNPATFSRDLGQMVRQGYALTDLVLIDMFPCTGHIEVMARLLRSDHGESRQ